MIAITRKTIDIRMTALRGTVNKPVAVVEEVNPGEYDLLWDRLLDIFETNKSKIPNNFVLYKTVKAALDGQLDYNKVNWPVVKAYVESVPSVKPVVATKPVATDDYMVVQYKRVMHIKVYEPDASIRILDVLFRGTHAECVAYTNKK